MSPRLAFLRPRRLHAALLALVVIGSAAPLLDHPAQGDQPQLIPQAPVGLTTGRAPAVQRADCATTNLAGRRGVTTTSWTASKMLSVAVRMSGPAGSDWDLAVFDHATGRRLGGSAAWGSNELVQFLARPGEVLDIQACHVHGPAASVPLTVDSSALSQALTTRQAATEQIVHIEIPNPQAYGMLERLGIDLVENGNSTGVDATIHSPAELELLHKAGFRTQVRIPDLAAFDRQQARLNADYTRRVRLGLAGPTVPSGRTEYRHLADIQADLKKLAEQYPAIVRPVTLPVKTYQGRDTMGVELSADVNRSDDQKPVSFIMGEHHAREWPSEELTTEFAIYLAQQFGTNQEITALLQHVRVVDVPVINSDGFNASREAPDFADQSGDPGGAPSLLESVGAGGSLAYRRKNCHGLSPDPSTPCDTQTGVDPNRNYGFKWGGPGASSSPNSQTYRGTGPWSEPETQAVHQYSQTHDVTSLLTMHNFASLVLRPPGLHNDGQAPDETRLKALGDAMGADTGYTSEYGYQLYDTSGTTEDWNYGAAGTFGYTMELGPDSGSGGNFHISYDRGVVQQWNGTGDGAGRGVRRALLRIAEAAASRQDFSTLVGRAPVGRILRLHKTFMTSTSPVCQLATVTDLSVSPPSGPTGAPQIPDQSCINPGDPILVPDKLDYTTRVSSTGVFAWLVTPSTRPFEHKKGKSESYTLTCEDAAGKVYESRQVTIWRGEVQSFTLPCGGQLLGTSTPTTVAQVERLQPRDRLAPRSTFNRRAVRAGRNGLAFSGLSIDSAPAGLAPRVAKVLVSIGRRTGRLCRWLTPQGTYGAPVSCLRTPYVVARVAAPASRVTWAYTLGAKLIPGRYMAWVRGVDAAGNIELKDKRRNLLTFKIR